MARMTSTRIDWIALSNWRNASAAPSRMSRPPPPIRSSTISTHRSAREAGLSPAIEGIHRRLDRLAYDPTSLGHSLNCSQEPVFRHEPPMPMTATRYL